MKALKKIGIGLLAIVLLLVIVSLFLPHEVHVERSTVIHASTETVFNQVNELQNWKNWSPWNERDSEMKSTFSEQTSGAGAWTEWTSETEGSGKLTIMESDPSKQIRNKLEMADMGNPSFGTWTFEEGEEGTLVNWKMDVDMGWNLIGRYIGLMFDGMMGPDFEKGLSNLKAFCESIPEKPKVEVTKVTIDQKIWLLSIKDTSDMEEMNAIHATIYIEISEFMKENEIQPTGAPLTIYHQWDMESNMVIMEAGIPVQDSVETTGRISMSAILPCNAITANHMGDYNKLGETHTLIHEWMQENNVETTGAPWEVYMTDPRMEKDITKWQTAIFYPI